MSDKPRSGRPPKRIGAVEMAAIIAYADLNTDGAAAKRYRVSVKTIQRSRKAMREGRAPELADLVAAAKARVVEKHGDLLDQAYEQGLRRIQKLIPQATIDQAIKATEMLGELKFERDLFGNEASTPVPARPGSAAVQARAGRDASDPATEGELH